MNRFTMDMKKYWNYTVYSAKSQLKAEVANSYLNWLWWILEPLCFMIMYSLIFGLMLGRNSIQYYNAYIFIGLSLWDFFNRCVKSSVGMVKRNKSIVAKVYLPKYTLIISDMMVNAFKMIICLILSLVLLVIYRVPVDAHFLMIIPVLVVMVMFTFGCCTILMHIGVFVSDMSNVINIVLRFVFYLTGIFYSIRKIMPEPYSSLLLKGNPLAFLAEGMRDAMLYRSMPSIKWLAVWFVISLVLSMIGIKIVYKSENTYVKVI